MIIFGDQDRCIPVAHAYSAHEAIPGSELHVIPGVGHQPQVQCPETVARLVGDFVDKSATALSWRGARQGLRAVPA
jgi:pimeloyl-ACP methyl ester carboxylesterase